MHVPLELIRKYNIPGPRYTSYPPATQFREAQGQEQWLNQIKESNKTPRDLSLYFHLPFCKSLCWYCGCTTVITTQQKESEKYLAYVERELELMATLLHPDREVVQIHLGGGTPTFLKPDELRQLGKVIRGRFKISQAVEASVEIDPRGLTAEHIAALREGGFNRASIGVQDFNPEVQLAVHRFQPKEMTVKVIQDLRKAGFDSINIDLIYGLPKQTVESFEKTLDGVLELSPDRVTAFSYAHVPWIKPAQKILEAGELPSPETKLQLLKLTVEKLTSNGYVYIGMDHFAKKSDPLALAQQAGELQRNFQGYSTCKGADIYGFGMSSISQGPNFYWQNEKELEEYYRSIDAGQLPLARSYYLTRDDEIRRYVIMRLMCDLKLDFNRISRKWNIDAKEYFARELESLDALAKDHLIEVAENGLEVTELGRLFIRNIAMKFDPLCREATNNTTGPEAKFSRTI